MPYTKLGSWGTVLRDTQFIQAGRLRSGTITSQEIIVAGGAAGLIRSQNYDGASTGWAISGDGTSSLYRATILMRTGSVDDIPLQFPDATNMGLWGVGATIRWGIDGTEGGFLFNRGLRVVAGTVTDPSLSPVNDGTTGIYFPASNQIAIAIDGNQELLMGTGGFLVPNVYNEDHSGGNTVVVDSNGKLHRNTSALRRKENVKRLSGFHLAMLADIRLEPATWTKNGVEDMGLIADWLEVQHPLLGVYDDDGEIDDYRDRAVLAVMAAKINRLERTVQALLSE